MKVWIFTICWNEARMAPWFLRHYAPWVDRIVAWCEPSTDGTEAILKACPKVDLRVWPHKGLNDEAFMWAVNQCYQSYQNRIDCDWLAFVDMDELLYHPQMETMLEFCNPPFNSIQAKGYALISPTGWPADDGHSQIYDLVKTGVPQSNYDKVLLARPSAKMQHAIGRHTYDPQFPKQAGMRWTGSGLKLLHLHYLGGEQDTGDRNRRNYDRCINKKYAWNMVSHDPKQVGTVEWVKESMKKLVNVV